MNDIKDIAITLLQTLVNATGAEFEDEKFAVDIITTTITEVVKNVSTPFMYEMQNMLEVHQYQERKCAEVKDYNNAAYHSARAGVISDLIIKAKNNTVIARSCQTCKHHNYNSDTNEHTCSVNNNRKLSDSLNASKCNKWEEF
jgi:hypothetical protein